MSKTDAGAADAGAADAGAAGSGTAGAGAAGATAWFHCFAGIAGDMAMGSLLDAGADIDEVQALLKRLPFSGWSLRTEPVLRGGIAATRAVVSVTDNVVVRTHAHIVGLVEAAALPDRVARRSLAVFAALAAAEGRLHRRPVDQVHFHEVGGHDTIVDVVGTVAALEVLGVDVVTASPVATGTGMVRAAHGMLPNPAPAVVALLEGAPTWGRDLAVELTTPTGAALLAALSSGFGPMPSMRIVASGFGAGTRELNELPNCTQVVLGRPVTLPGSSPDAGAGQPVMLLEANVDDATGEQLAYAAAALLDMGAHDAWLSPILMKKGRPGTTIHVLCDPADAERLRASLREETGTLGVRGATFQRWPAPRTMGSIEVADHAIRIKVSPGRIKAEFDDVARAARDTGIPLQQVAARAEAAWRSQHGEAETDARPPGRGRDEDPTA
ncbi:MAG TPA: nickel pincer cofactor biosynthesis protein LarC [Acidimicrobiales bacterium]|nr:nickel pincer cofactor biosynthesis protein LarC [Acidimicrobiales bacterium]